MYEPLHLVIIEEPEAHLHAQVQQVFIKNAYNILRNHSDLRDTKTGADLPQFNTQLIVSTHSNHIVHEVDYACLRYFKREFSVNYGHISRVINLSDTFGEGEKTSKFVSRYLRATHCDIFFADAVILVEGSAERIFMPLFIKENFADLAHSYISLIEINGRHAHTLRPLIEKLGIKTLIVCDLDTEKLKNMEKGQKMKSDLPKQGDDQETGSQTLRTWIPKKQYVDDLMSITEDNKISTCGNIRVAYQCIKTVSYDIVKDGSTKEITGNIIPYSFEDAFAFDNIAIFQKMDDCSGLAKQIKKALELNDIDAMRTKIYESLKSARKAEFAIDMIFSEDFNNIIVPEYIANGLKWLSEELAKNN